jgi:photosystem II stability/assembly factor-like uncharacterized protein
VATNTTQTITGISAPHAGELIFVTSAGSVSYLTAAGTFAAAAVTPANPTGFTGVAMSADGTKGVAIGALGKIYRSADAGVTWNKLASTPTEYTDEYPTPSATTEPLTDHLYSDMAWSTPSTGFFLSNDFGEYWATTDSFAHAADVGSGVNGSTGTDRLAVDPASPNRAWATGEGLGSTFLRDTTDGGVDWQDPDYDNGNQSFQDIAFSGAR